MTQSSHAYTYENSGTEVIFFSGQFQVFLHTLDLGVADISTVQERQQIENGKHWNQPQVHLPENLFRVNVGDVDIAALPIWVMTFGVL